MPEMDGLRATEMIRQREAHMARCTPIIAITALATEADMSRCRTAGMNDVITKPLRAEEFQAKVERWATSSAGGGDQINRAYLAELSGGDIQFECDLLELYAATAPGTLAALGRAVEAGDFGAAEDAAHTLNGSSRSIGAEAVAELCEHVEELASSANAAVLPPQFKRLEKLLSDLLQEIEKFRERRSSREDFGA
jgi:two-component system, sensor histidine kinase and response regulator